MKLSSHEINEIKEIKNTSAGGKLMKFLRCQVEEERLAFDHISVDQFNYLQGRLSGLKNIVKLLGGSDGYR